MGFSEKFLALLRVRMSAAGLEVSDEVLRLAIFDGKTWAMHGVRLEPGILEKGKIKKWDAFVAALTALKAEMGPSNKNKLINVVACLSSLEVYTQSFQLPIVQGKGLDDAIALNLQMASPIEANEAYSSWQIIGHGEATGKLEIVAAFAERKAIDDVADALFHSGFIAMAVESRGFALTRLIREKAAGVDIPKSYLFVNVDNFGLDFLIIRNGALYFEYANPWHDLMDEKGEITGEKFSATIAGSLRQVLNFYGQHWSDPLGAVILSTAVFQEEAEKVISENAPAPAVRLTLVMGQPISSEWLVALGSSLRSGELKGKDPEINLLGENSRDRFHEQRLLHFLGYWEVAMPVALGILVLTFVGASLFLGNMIAASQAGSGFTLNGSQLADMASFEATAKNFNSSIALFASAEHNVQPKYLLLGKAFDAATAAGVTISRISFQSFTAPITITGSAVSSDHLAAFKTALESDPAFVGVNVPITGVQFQGSAVTFSMTFSFSPSIAAKEVSTASQ